MRKTVFIICLTGCCLCHAAPVSVTKARQAVIQFLETSQDNPLSAKTRAGSKDQLDLAYTYKGTSDNLIYVFNKPDNGGFVLASADDRTPSILGFAEKGSFHVNSIPDGLKVLMGKYKEQIEHADKSRLLAQTRNTDNQRTDIEPLILTQWDQREPYNSLCPIDPNTGERSITGCSAVAFAQLMYYHQYPRIGQNSISYNWNGIVYSADFSKVEFEWEKMKLTYESDTPDTDNAVATLIYNTALALKSEFSSEDTNGWFDTELLHKYFGYKDEVKYLAWSEATKDDFSETIYQDLAKGLPVIYWASATEDWSHVFLIDGYKGDNYFHMNFGWNGDSDGYYLLNAIDLDWISINDAHCILYNIQPAIEDKWFIYTNDGRIFEMSDVGSLEADPNDDTYFNIYGLSGQVLASEVSSVSFVCTSGVNPASFPKGDANCDGLINAADIVETVNAVLGKPSEKFIEFNGDVNNDGIIDSKDIEEIVKLIMSSSSSVRQ